MQRSTSLVLNASRVLSVRSDLGLLAFCSLFLPRGTQNAALWKLAPEEGQERCSPLRPQFPFLYNNREYKKSPEWSTGGGEVKGGKVLRCPPSDPSQVPFPRPPAIPWLSVHSLESQVRGPCGLPVTLDLSEHSGDVIMAIDGFHP